MEYKGPLGFSRPFGIGPFTYSQQDTQLAKEQIEDIVAEVIKEENIDPNAMTRDELMTIVGRLSEEMGIGQSFLANCIESEWAEESINGMVNITAGEAGETEKLILKANSCQGLIKNAPVHAVIMLSG